jgi:hypothetical protein
MRIAAEKRERDEHMTVAFAFDIGALDDSANGTETDSLLLSFIEGLVHHASLQASQELTFSCGALLEYQPLTSTSQAMSRSRSARTRGDTYRIQKRRRDVAGLTGSIGWRQGSARDLLEAAVRSNVIAIRPIDLGSAEVLHRVMERESTSPLSQSSYVGAYELMNEGIELGALRLVHDVFRLRNRELRVFGDGLMLDQTQRLLDHWRDSGLFDSVG